MKRFYAMLLLIFLAGCHYSKSPEMRLCSRLDWQSILDIFPKNVHQIIMMKNKSTAIIDEMIESIKSVQPMDHNFHNTVRVYDNAKFKFMMHLQMLSTLAMLSSDKQIRSAANNAVIALQQFQAEHLVRNPIILHAFQQYAQHGHDDQSKTVSTRTFLQKSINQLEHEGANLSPAIRSQLSHLSKEIRHLEGQFCAHILHHSGSIVCKKNDLAGVPDSFLAKIAYHGSGYKIPLTYDSFFTILENCTVAATRKKFFLEFNRRVYPKNEQILIKLLEKRNEYARLVGYENFAEYECSLQMIGSVQRAQGFIQDMITQTNKVVAPEFEKLIRELPASVSLSASGKLEPWDESFVRCAYRKKHFDLNAAAIAEYFSVDNVMLQLENQFGQFFGLSFDAVDPKGLWHQDVTCMRVRLLKTNKIIGYIIFDLYARPGKSEQASQISVIPAIADDCNLVCSGLSTIVTNFVQAGQGRETLLEFHDVKTLFHEFGHALQELFGATEFVDIAGSKGPRDFIEVPSQLLEMWLHDAQIIKKFSQHYITKQPLPDAMIQKIIEAEKFGRASLLQRQCLLSLIALDFGRIQHHEKPHDIVGRLYKQVRFDVEYCPQDYFEAGFEHLVTYGSHYYGYVWSQVLAAELFEYIHEHGIENNDVGQKLYAALLAHGGSKDPHQLIEMLTGESITKKSLLDSLQR